MHPTILLLALLTAAPPVVYVKAGRLLDGVSEAPRKDQAIVIDGERIKLVGPQVTTPIPEGAKVIDLSRSTVLPGLIDCHTHLDSRSDRQEQIDEFLLTPFDNAFAAVKNARLTLEAGFTTVRDLSSWPFELVDLRKSVDEGFLPGPRIVASGPMISTTGGHGDFDGYSPETSQTLFPAQKEFAIADGADQMRQLVRAQMKYGVDVIKVAASGGVMSHGDQPGAPQMSFEELAAAVEAAHDGGRKVAAHAHGAEAIKRAVRAGVDSIEHGSLIDDDGIALMRAHGTWLVPTPYTLDFIVEKGPELKLPEQTQEKARAVAKQSDDTLRRAIKAGVKVAYGTDAGNFPNGTNARQFTVMTRVGMSPAAIIRSATSSAAELLGRSADVGSLQPGRYADLIAVDGDPLADLRLLEQIPFVMKGGKVVKDHPQPVPVAAKDEVLYVKAGRLFDGTGDGPRANQALIVEGGHIKAVGPAATLTAPAGAKVIDLGNQTVLPGLIDCHTHLSSRAEHGAEIFNFTDTPFDNAFFAFEYAERTLKAGFTTVRDLGSWPFLAVDLRKNIEEGFISGPRIVASGPPLSITGGHGDLNGFNPQTRVFMFPDEKDFSIADGVDQVRHAVRAQVKYGVDVIKIHASGGVLSLGDKPGTPQYSLEELKAAVEEAHKAGKKIAAHAHGTLSIKQAVLAGIDSVEHGTLIDDEGIRLMKERGTWLVADIYSDVYLVEHGREDGVPEESMQKEIALHKESEARLRKAIRAGVKVAFGTDSGTYPHGDNAKNLVWLVNYGLTPAQAIRTATSGAAELLGRDDLGQLKPGRFADLIAVPGDPFKDVTVLQKIPFVMKGGQVVKDER